jgi:hypothetical protein
MAKPAAIQNTRKPPIEEQERVEDPDHVGRGGRRPSAASATSASWARPSDGIAATRAARGRYFRSFI